MSKNSFKKLVYLLLSAVMIMGMSVNIFANEIDAVNIDSILMQRGYPQIVLEKMDDDVKSIILTDDTTFAGAIISYYDEDDGTFADITVNEDGSYIDPRGQIPTADLSLTWVFNKSTTSNGKLNTIRVTFNYNWLHLPIFRWQDPVSISWDDTKFQMKPGSFEKIDKYDGIIVNNVQIVSTVINQVHSYEQGYASSSNAGVTWYADLKGYTGVSPTKLYGHGTFTLNAKSGTSSGSTIFYSHYIHPTTSMNVGVTIPGYGNFSVNSGSGYDERGNHISFSW